MTTETIERGLRFKSIRFLLTNYGRIAAVCSCVIALSLLPLFNHWSQSSIAIGGLVAGTSIMFFGVVSLLEWRARQIRFQELVEWIDEIRAYAVGSVDELREAVGTLEGKGETPPPPSIAASFASGNDDRPLMTRERNTLLAVIAALCKESGIDYTRSSAAAAVIKNLTVSHGLNIGETTIEMMLKKIPDALEARSSK